MVGVHMKISKAICTWAWSNIVIIATIILIIELRFSSLDWLGRTFEFAFRFFSISYKLKVISSRANVIGCRLFFSEPSYFRFEYWARRAFCLLRMLPNLQLLLYSLPLQLFLKLCYFDFLFTYFHYLLKIHLRGCPRPHWQCFWSLFLLFLQ